MTGASSAVATAVGVNLGLSSQFATFPLGSSSGGFVWDFDESAGTYNRKSESFGPSFAERAMTIGRNRFSLAFNYQHTTYDKFEGQSLDSGDLHFYLPHTDCCGTRDNLQNLPFEGDVIDAAISLKAKSDTFTMFATYGVTNKWDVAVAIPFSKLSLDMRLDADILRLSTAANPTIHMFQDGTSHASYETTGSASGVGDMVLRTKYPVGGLAWCAGRGGARPAAPNR